MRNFFNQLSYKLSSFMYGRYGNDRLNNAIAVLYFILIIFSGFLRFILPGFVLRIIRILEYALIIILFYRTFSKNIYKRQRENRAWLSIWCDMQPELEYEKNKFVNAGTYVYKKCPACSAKLRFKRVKGRHSVQCPRCGKNFKMTVFYGGKK